MGLLAVYAQLNMKSVNFISQHYVYSNPFESETSLCFFKSHFLIVSGGRSRLHLIDLGSCVKPLSKNREGGSGVCLSLSALGNVILALVNGSKHIPYK